jgi:hypothetical protein
VSPISTDKKAQQQKKKVKWRQLIEKRQQPKRK